MTLDQKDIVREASRRTLSALCPSVPDLYMYYSQVTDSRCLIIVNLHRLIPNFKCIYNESPSKVESLYFPLLVQHCPCQSFVLNLKRYDASRPIRRLSPASQVYIRYPFPQGGVLQPFQSSYVVARQPDHDSCTRHSAFIRRYRRGCTELLLFEHLHLDVSDIPLQCIVYECLTFCPSINRSIGAVAELYDISCLVNTPELATIQNRAYDLWSAIPSKESAEIPTCLKDLDFLKLGLHYFITNPVTGSGLSPEWDFTSTGSNAGNKNAFVVAAKVGDLPAPTGSADVDWLSLKNVEGDLATQVRSPVLHISSGVLIALAHSDLPSCHGQRPATCIGK